MEVLFIHILLILFIIYSVTYLLSMIFRSIYFIYENTNPQYDIESLQLENDLLRKNIKRLENIIYEKQLIQKKD